MYGEYEGRRARRPGQEFIEQVCSPPMGKRRYRLGRRTEGLEATRRRITRAAMALHVTRGPARTTIDAIARRAGVQRLTVYRHFPSLRLLFEACGGLHREL